MRVARVQLKGKCNFCGESFSGSAMGRHLGVCKSRKRVEMEISPSVSNEELLDIEVKGTNGFFTYWLYLEVNSNRTLKDIDILLKKIWVECCGHLSQFVINGVNYAAYHGSSMGDKSMKAKLGDVLNEREVFVYEYDFGTTTTLNLKVISTRVAPPAQQGKNQITIQARNDPPEISCDICDSKKASQVCAQCIWDGEEAWLCDRCASKHVCGEDMLLPVVNSPRVGVCVYTG